MSTTKCLDRFACSWWILEGGCWELPRSHYSCRQLLRWSCFARFEPKFTSLSDACREICLHWLAIDGHELIVSISRSLLFKLSVWSLEEIIDYSTSIRRNRLILAQRTPWSFRLFSRIETDDQYFDGISTPISNSFVVQQMNFIRILSTISPMTSIRSKRKRRPSELRSRARRTKSRESSGRRS